MKYRVKVEGIVVVEADSDTAAREAARQKTSLMDFACRSIEEVREQSIAPDDGHIGHKVN